MEIFLYSCIPYLISIGVLGVLAVYLCPTPNSLLSSGVFLISLQPFL
jgi:hypothetical protein